MKTIKMLLVSLLLMFILAIAMPANAQQTGQANATGDGAGNLPISAIIDQALNAHEQDIKDRMFDYQFNAAKDNPDAQANIVKKRGEELKAEANDKKSLIEALLNEDQNGTIPEERLAAMMDETNKSLERVMNSSSIWEDHAMELTMVSGHQSYTGVIKPLVTELDQTRSMAQNESSKANDRLAKIKQKGKVGHNDVSMPVTGPDYPPIANENNGHGIEKGTIISSVQIN